MPACSIILGCLGATSAMFGAEFGAIAAGEKPNILWITSEDNGVSWVSCYGGTNAKTPTIDKLAKEGFRYTHCFDNAAAKWYGAALLRFEPHEFEADEAHQCLGWPFSYDALAPYYDEAERLLDVHTFENEPELQALLDRIVSGDSVTR